VKENNFQNKIIHATKWATITEIAAKLVAPITNMVLARLLIPEAFGVVATVTMIISFADIFTDAGFQKYLVQREFNNDEEKYQNTNVAFWTNLGISLVLWAIIALFCEPIATMVGNPGLGIVIVVACAQLPLTSFSSIQMALYRRNFDFKTLFMVRIISICIPFFVTIPLAFLGFSYWALIIGTLCGQLSNAIILTVKSEWKPKLFYRITILKEMLSFSIWSLIEAISIWFTSWIDTLIIASVLTTYYLGLYKTSTVMVAALMGIITSAIAPVLFSALSRLQNDKEHFNNMFFKTQRVVSILIFPLGVGVYLYSDLATQIILGSQWSEASGVIAHWALTSAIMIVFGNFCSEVYRAKGLPKLSFLAQVLHLIVLVPVCIYSSKFGFWALVYARAWIRLQFVLVHFVIMKLAIGIPVSRIIRNVLPSGVSAIIMGFAGFFLQQLYDGIAWSFLSILMCVLLYFLLLYLFPSMRVEMKGVLKKFKPRVA
jgi:PST family polysaccharide transporter